MDAAPAVVPLRSRSSVCPPEQSSGGSSAVTTHPGVDVDGLDGAAPAGIDHSTAVAWVDLACAAAGRSADRVGVVDSSLALGPAVNRSNAVMAAVVVAPGLSALGVACPAALALAPGTVPSGGGVRSGWIEVAGSLDPRGAMGASVAAAPSSRQGCAPGDPWRCSQLPSGGTAESWDGSSAFGLGGRSGSRWDGAAGLLERDHPHPAGGTTGPTAIGAGSAPAE